MTANSNTVPKLGFGCMRFPLTDPKDVTAIDIDQVKEMVDLFMDAGGTYFDTAFVYHDGHSEVALREALVERYPRDSFTIATKCLAWALPDAEAAKACLDTSLERLGTDYVDYYLLHNVGGERTKKFDDFGLWEWAQEMKAAGKIRNVGFSMHDGAETLDQLLNEHPEVDFVQLQVNYLDWESPVVQSRRNMEVARKHGKPVVIMEPARGGRLADLPAAVAAPLLEARPDLSQASWAYRFCYNQPGVLTVLFRHVHARSGKAERRRMARAWRRVLPRGAGGTGCGVRSAGRRAHGAVHQLPLLRERLPAADCHSRDHEPVEPGGSDGEHRVRQAAI